MTATALQAMNKRNALWLQMSTVGLEYERLYRLAQVGHRLHPLFVAVLCSSTRANKFLLPAHQRNTIISHLWTRHSLAPKRRLR